MNESEILTDKMRGLRDEELVQIAFSTEADGFRDEYIEAARGEIERREIQASDLESLKFETSVLKSLEESKVDDPLGLVGRVLFFVFCATWLARLIHRG